MDVLFIGTDTSKFISRSFYYLEQELAKYINLHIWRKSGHINHILNKFHKKPDFILISNDLGQRLFPVIKGLAHITIPVGLIITDVHRLTRMRENYIVKNKINHLFTVGRDQTIQTYPQFKHKLEWLPHFIHPEIYKDYKQDKTTPLLMMGAVNDVYPLRKRILEVYRNDSRFTYHSHPGYRDFNIKEEEKNLIGERYAKELNQAKIFFTSPSILNYPVMKYFEALGTKTLLLAPTFKELEDLKFVPGKHFVAIDESNFQEKAAYYLANENERQEIVEQGYRFIHEEHTVKVRAMELIKRIEHILT